MYNLLEMIQKVTNYDSSAWLILWFSFSLKQLQTSLEWQSVIPIYSALEIFFSALEIFLLMRYINLRLLTYLLTYYKPVRKNLVTMLRVTEYFAKSLKVIQNDTFN